MITDETPYLFHITWVTHSSRISLRMRKYNSGLKPNPIVLSLKQEIDITGYIAQIVIEDKLKIFNYNIYADHLHLILFCQNNKRDNIVRKLKGKSTQLYKNHNKIENEFHLWGQKYNYWAITSDEQLASTYEYIKHNRTKHNL